MVVLLAGVVVLVGVLLLVAEGVELVDEAGLDGVVDVVVAVPADMVGGVWLGWTCPPDITNTANINNTNHGEISGSLTQIIYHTRIKSFTE